ncbi:MAG: hypothetical protein KDJ29_13020 [Hyphomicrobiales bacterium]|nr:hypothetical protein [Hyphomicrobiales bacterium]
MRWLASLILSVFFALAGMAFVTPSVAQDKKAAPPIPAPVIPAPVIPKGAGDKCVADTPTMRRYHMNFLMHKRDATVHQGVRTKQYSLENCFTCHTVKGKDGKVVGYENPKHFCRSCHDYVAVKVDCFECHNSKPELKPKLRASGVSPVEHAAVAKYLREMGR